MNDPKNSANLGPSDVRGISDPPDMGRLKPAEEVAREMVSPIDVMMSMVGPDTYHFGVGGLRCSYKDHDVAMAQRKAAIAMLAMAVEQGRTEGAAAALEAAAVALDAAANRSLDGKPHGDTFAQGKAKGYDGAAHILRARAKGISDPPDMG